MIYQNDISNLKSNIANRIGEKIIVKGSLGRSKLFEKEATIEKTYPNIFVVKYHENDRSVSYQYKDVLTRTVEVDAFDGNEYKSLMPPLIKKTRRPRNSGLQVAAEGATADAPVTPAITKVEPKAEL